MNKKFVLGVTVLLIVFLNESYLMAQDPLTRLQSLSTNRAESEEIIDQIIDQGPQMIPNLVSFLAEKKITMDLRQQKRTWSTKVTAMNILSEWKAVEALGTLEDMLKSSNNLSAIYNSARTIGRIGDKKSFQILKQVLLATNNSIYTRNKDRKKASILGLGLCGEKNAIPLLRRELFDLRNDEITRVYAADSLGLLGNSEGLEVALNGIKSENKKVKLYSIEALGMIGSANSLSVLGELAQPQEEYVYRAAAKTAILQIEADQLPETERVQYIYLKLLEHPRNTKWVLLGTSKLKKINTESSRKTLDDLSKNKKPDVSFLRKVSSIKLRTMN